MEKQIKLKKDGTPKKTGGKKGNKGGRPTVMTAETIQRLRDAYAMDCTDEEACSHANIGRRTLYDYQEKNPDFIEEKEKLKQKPFLLARNSIIQGIKSNPELALKYMERKKKLEFSLRTELTGTEGKEIKIILQKGSEDL